MSDFDYVGELIIRANAESTRIVLWECNLCKSVVQEKYKNDHSTWHSVTDLRVDVKPNKPSNTGHELF